MDVPFHNELRLFIGEGPLFGDMDIGSSRTENLLLYLRRDMTFGRIQVSFRTSPCDLLRRADTVTPRNTGLLKHYIHSDHKPLTGRQRVPKNAAAPGVYLRQLCFSVKGSVQIAPHPG